MWNHNYHRNLIVSDKTDNGFMVITLRCDPEFNAKYETLVFPLMRNGEINADRCIETKMSSSEDEAYLCHLKTWESYSRG